MATAIAEYYLDELVDWKPPDRFLQPWNGWLWKKTAKVNHRNTIPGIAARVERELITF